jgi:uncharacterized protein YndB with AHSA1/START domain
MNGYAPPPRDHHAPRTKALPRRPGATAYPPGEFWARFLDALKCHLEQAPTANGNPEKDIQYASQRGVPNVNGHVKYSGPSAGSAANDTLLRDYEAATSFRAPADAVFGALTTTSGLSGWWTRATGSGSTGGELTFLFGDLRKVIRVDETKRPSVVRWTVLVSEPLRDWEGTTIEFDLSADEAGGSRLHFRHHGLTPQLECFDSCSDAWTRFLGSLAEYLETGHGDPFDPTGL